MQEETDRMTGEVSTEEDRRQMEELGITGAEANRQLAIFRKGPQRLELARPCTPGDGIVVLEKGDHERLTAFWETAALQGRLSTFVPASGAATRMFAFLQRIRKKMGRVTIELIQNNGQVTESDRHDFQRFVGSLEEFALFEPLAKVMAKQGVFLPERVRSGDYTEILNYLLGSQGLNYGSLPKALIPFHRYSDHVRTALEEHLVEASYTVRDEGKRCRIHFTVAPESEEAVIRHAQEAAQRFSERFGVQYELTFSTRSPATNTLAVDPENRPFRQSDGRLLFRPGGHGALLENLDILQGDLVLIKNIDNVVTDHHRGPVIFYQKVLAGLLLELQHAVFHYLRLLSSNNVAELDLEEMLDFTINTLSAAPDKGFWQSTDEQKASQLFRLLNRPLRVCGMVENRGEPRGGPFWVREPSGRLGRQIIEGSQVDKTSPEQVSISESSTHFNPVNLVCGLRGFRGRPFNLSQFVDPQAVFISRKTKSGRELKTLELPGLWNGGMAYWNTVFVEVPEETFNPAKTINDLLRPGHRTEG